MHSWRRRLFACLLRRRQRAQRRLRRLQSELGRPARSDANAAGASGSSGWRPFWRSRAPWDSAGRPALWTCSWRCGRAAGAAGAGVSDSFCGGFGKGNQGGRPAACGRHGWLPAGEVWNVAHAHAAACGGRCPAPAVSGLPGAMPRVAGTRAPLQAATASTAGAAAAGAAAPTSSVPLAGRALCLAGMRPRLSRAWGMQQGRPQAWATSGRGRTARLAMRRRRRRRGAAARGQMLRASLLPSAAVHRRVAWPRRIRMAAATRQQAAARRRAAMPSSRARRRLQTHPSRSCISSTCSSRAAEAGEAALAPAAAAGAGAEAAAPAAANLLLAAAPAGLAPTAAGGGAGAGEAVA